MRSFKLLDRVSRRPFFLLDLYSACWFAFSSKAIASIEFHLFDFVI